jgi:hypothetical protein
MKLADWRLTRAQELAIEYGALAALTVLAVVVVLLAVRQARTASNESEPAEDVIDDWGAVQGPEPVALIAGIVPAPAAQRQQSAIPIVPEPDLILTGLAASSVDETSEDEAVALGRGDAPSDAIQLGPPIERPSVPTRAPASAATRMVPSSRRDLVRLISRNRREQVVAPPGTLLVTESGAMVRTLEQAVVPCATDGGPGSAVAPVRFVGARPAGFESGQVVDVGQIDLVTAIMSSLPRAR